jgi:hypothetical protein
MLALTPEIYTRNWLKAIYALKTAGDYVGAINEANRLIDFLEASELQIRYCRLCEHIIADNVTNEAHILSRSHKKIRDDLQIKDLEDLQLSIIVMHSVPGDIEKELVKEKEKALKRKVKRIKA